MRQGVPIQGLRVPLHRFARFTAPVPPAPVEMLELTIDSGADVTFYLPIGGRINGVFQGFSWVIDWGDGTVENHSGTSSPGDGIPHTYPAADTIYTIKIMAQNPDELGWLRAFGFYAGDPENAEKLIRVSGNLTERMIRTADTDKNVLESWFKGCASLREIDLVLPQELKIAGNYFACSTFERCEGLVSGVAKFFGSLALPQSELDKTGVYSFTFGDCKKVAESLENIPQLQAAPSVKRNTFSGVPAASTLNVNWR